MFVVHLVVSGKKDASLSHSVVFPAPFKICFDDLAISSHTVSIKQKLSFIFVPDVRFCTAVFQELGMEILSLRETGSLIAANTFTLSKLLGTCT